MVDGTLGRLRQLLTLTAAHVSSELDQDSLHGVFALPVGEAGQLRGVDDAVARINAGEVHHADELNRRGLVGVLIAAVHLDGIDSVFVHALVSGVSTVPCLQPRLATTKPCDQTYMGRTEDSAIPVGHEQILWVIQTITACLCTARPPACQ